MNKHFFWITFISKRLANVDREGRTKVSSVLSLLGICFGVMTLIVVLSVMNGFQSEFKNAILELSSYHLRVENVPSAYEYDFINFLENEKLVDAVVPFYEAESFIVSETDNQSVAFIRALPQNVCYLDAGFKNELEMISGDFLLEDEEQI
ncbi:MAG: ABC transporter permease, partial [Treponema sp.]|nr:ABC transporter permease [Treponema sp.]